jgi:hypothetical protein
MFTSQRRGAESGLIRRSRRTGPHTVGFGITDNLCLAQIELQASLQLPIVDSNPML